MQTLHLKITQSVREYRKQEAILIDLVQDADFTRFYLELGYGSTFDYLCKGQNLSAATACNLISVARASAKIPEIREAIASGAVGLAKIRKLTPVITQNNHKEWIEKSKTLSCRELEKEVAKNSSYKPRREHWQRINSDYLRLSLDVTEEFRSLAERAKDVLSKKQAQSANLSQVLQWALKEALAKHDPIEIAKRRQDRLEKQSKNQSVTVEGLTNNPKNTVNTNTVEMESQSVTTSNRYITWDRVAVPKSVIHEVNLRDGGRCTVTHNGKRCNQTRFVEFHHIQKVKDGGKNTADNLQTLCNNHHVNLHLQEEIQESILKIREWYKCH